MAIHTSRGFPKRCSLWRMWAAHPSSTVSRGTPVVLPPHAARGQDARRRHALGAAAGPLCTVACAACGRADAHLFPRPLGPASRKLGERLPWSVDGCGHDHGGRLRRDALVKLWVLAACERRHGRGRRGRHVARRRAMDTSSPNEGNRRPTHTLESHGSSTLDAPWHSTLSCVPVIQTFI